MRARIEAMLNNWRRKPPTREGYLESAGALAEISWRAARPSAVNSKAIPIDLASSECRNGTRFGECSVISKNPFSK